MKKLFKFSALLSTVLLWSCTPKEAPLASVEVEGEQAIRSAGPWLDTEGKKIEAHGFQVFYNEQDSTYYWYGENKEYTKRHYEGDLWHWSFTIPTGATASVILPGETEAKDYVAGSYTMTSMISSYLCSAVLIINLFRYYR